MAHQFMFATTKKNTADSADFLQIYSDCHSLHQKFFQTTQTLLWHLFWIKRDSCKTRRYRWSYKIQTHRYSIEINIQL